MNLKIISNDEATTGQVILETKEHIIIEGFMLLVDYTEGSTDDGFDLRFDVNFSYPSIPEIDNEWYTIPQATDIANVTQYLKTLPKGTYKMFLPIALPAPADFVRIYFAWKGTFTDVGTVKLGIIPNAYNR